MSAATNFDNKHQATPDEKVNEEPTDVVLSEWAHGTIQGKDVTEHYNAQQRFYKLIHAEITQFMISPSVTTVWAQLRRLQIEFTEIDALTIFPPLLEQLMVSNNKLTHLKGLPASVTDVDCSNNPIKDIDLSNTALVSIDFSRTLITALSSVFVKLPDSTESIRCSHNGIDTVVSLPPKTKILTIDNNLLEEFKCPDVPLVRLDIHNNKLRELMGLPVLTLQSLNVTGNLLESLPENMISLRYLMASSNKLRRLVIHGNVTTLLCAHNPLVSIRCYSTKLNEFNCLHTRVREIHLPLLKDMYRCHIDSSNLTLLRPMSLLKTFKQTHDTSASEEEKHEVHNNLTMLVNTAATIIQRAIIHRNSKGQIIIRWVDVAKNPSQMTLSI